MVGFKRISLIVERALKITADTGAKIVNYGENNLYPQEIANLIYASKTATAAVEKMTENIVCEGFQDLAFRDKTNEHGYNMDDVLDGIANDISRFKGFALVISYGQGLNGYYRKNVYNVPFEYVRAELNDNYLRDPFIKRYKVFNNWERENIKATNALLNSIAYPAYNPDTFAQEVEDYGGIENHPGQLLYVSFGTTKPYPLSTFHAVRNEMSAEKKNGDYVTKTLGRGFHMASIVTHGDFENEFEQQDFVQALEGMMGSDNAGSVLTVRDPNASLPQANPFIRVDQIGSPIDKDLYKAYVEPLRKDIAIAAYNIPLPLIDSSLLTFSNASGEVIKELQKVYRNSLQKVRNRISRELSQVFDVDQSVCIIKNKFDDDLSVSKI